MKKGFTLVELSITLVIIGLLIGGILIAQSLIESAQANRVISSLKQYDSIVALFKERYRQLPGDSTLFTNSGTTDNDGKIESHDDQARSFLNESADFWVHLSEAGMVEETYSSTVTTDIVHGANVPKLLEGGIIAGYAPIIGGYSFGFNDNYFIVVDTEEFNGTSYRTPIPSEGLAYHGFLKPRVVISIDNKIDDGSGWTGDLKSMYVFTNSGAGGGSGPCDVSSDDDCVLYYMMQYDD